MKRASLFVLTVIFGAALSAPFAAAQIPANITMVGGSGQLICEGCSFLADFFFEPVAARVTDANGNPITNYAVNWSISSVGGAAYFNGFSGQTTVTTNTDATGTAVATPFLGTMQLGFGVYFSQATITAIAGNVSANYTVTNSLVDSNGNQGVYINYNQAPAAPPPSTLSGTAGGTGTPFTVQVYTLGGTLVPGVSVRLINLTDGTAGPSPTAPSAYCQTSAGADQWSVLTDSTGAATCTPVFGPVAGSAQVAILVGGTPAGIWVNGTLYNPGAVTYNPTAQFPATNLPTYGEGGAFSIVVKSASVGAIQATGGSGQSGSSGTTLPQLLQATVTDSSNHALVGQPVSWTVSPAAAGQLSNPSAVSDSSGHVSASLFLSSTAAGTVTVTVTSTSNSKASAVFTETAIPLVTISGLQKVSGDGQTAAEGATFANPLVVQVTVNGGSAANVPVQFAVTGGGASLVSSGSVSTTSSGQAQVSVKAGANPGTVTVSATAGSGSVVFTLTVSPPPPPISVSSFGNAADGKTGSLSPCSLATITSSGLMLQDGVAAWIGSMPYQYNNVSISFNGGDLAPIQSILTNASGQTAITFQVPCDVTPGSVPVVVNAGGGAVNVTLTVLPASPGIYSTLMSDGKTRAAIVREDGSFVSLTNPARLGEPVTAYVTGMGPVSPGIGTNGLPIPGTPSTVNGQVIVGLNNAGVPVTSARLSEDRIGVYEVSFQIPKNVPTGNDVVFSVALVPPGSSTPIYSNGSSIPIQ